jgi:hypothetical protein
MNASPTSPAPQPANLFAGTPVELPEELRDAPVVQRGCHVGRLSYIASVL